MEGGVEVLGSEVLAVESVDIHKPRESCSQLADNYHEILLVQHLKFVTLHQLLGDGG